MSKLSPNLEKILADAANDSQFRARLMEDRLSAIAERGHELTDTERSILEAVSDGELERMCATLADEHRPREFGFRKATPEERLEMERIQREIEREQRVCGGSRPSRPAALLSRLFWWLK